MKEKRKRQMSLEIRKDLFLLAHPLLYLLSALTVRR